MGGSPSGVTNSAERGEVRWWMGSDTPQNTRPMPMPVVNSMANQASVPNSGRESGGPRRIFPNRLSMRKIAITRKKVVDRT